MKQDQVNYSYRTKNSSKNAAHFFILVTVFAHRSVFVAPIDISGVQNSPIMFRHLTKISFLKVFSEISSNLAELKRSFTIFVCCGSLCLL